MTTMDKAAAAIAELARRQQAVKDAEAAVDKAGNDLIPALRAEWILRGGCDKCKGQGFTMEHFTLDYIAGEPVDCTCDRKAGLAPAYGSNGSSDTDPRITEALAPYRATLRAAQVALGWLTVVDKGVQVVVVKGRKVAHGTTGVVIWLGGSAYNNDVRLGIKDADGTVHWTAKSNVVVDADHADARAAAQARGNAAQAPGATTSSSNVPTGRWVGSSYRRRGYRGR